MIVESWCVCVWRLDIFHTSRFDICHTWVLGQWKGDNCCYILFTSVDPVRVLGHDHGPVLGVGVLVDLGRTFGWTCDVPKVDLPHLRRLWSLYWCA